MSDEEQELKPRHFDKVLEAAERLVERDDRKKNPQNWPTTSSAVRPDILTEKEADKLND